MIAPLWWRWYWKPRVVMVPTFSSQVAPQVVITTTYGVNSEGKVSMMATLGFWVARRYPSSWWRHDMETLSVSLNICEGNPQVTGYSPHKGPVMRTFGVSFWLAHCPAWTGQDVATIQEHWIFFTGETSAFVSLFHGIKPYKSVWFIVN